ncbi:hypothetical protein FNF31_02456 [Cafeteria roenbergensis]|uniref:K Homology domain-containing protein n=1 Tax=Cafeteria roenbergensis TaxID=33653 RepID=A0A5A8DJP1_CAFRO|nr:hypothetical protein FNF31_02456 [Cafeteria roenbergensis]
MASADSSFFSTGPLSGPADGLDTMSPDAAASDRVSVADALRRRRTELIDKRRALIDRNKGIRAEIDAIVRRMPRRPDASIERYEDWLEDLEEQRTTTTMSLNAEKQLIREMDQIRMRMRTVGDYNELEAQVQTLKDERDGISKALDALSAELDDCSAGLGNAMLLDRLLEARGDISGISADDIASKTIPIEPAAVPRIIGPKGSTRKRVESRFGVVLDIEDPARDAARGRGDSGRGRRGRPGSDKAADAAPAATTPSVLIRGLADDIDAATEYVLDLCATDTASVDVPRGVLNLLLHDSGALIREVEAEHVVRLNLSRGGSAPSRRRGASGARKGAADAGDASSKSASVEAEGRMPRVRAALKAIQQLKAIAKSLPMPMTVVLDVIGPAGSRVRKVQDECNVVVESYRPEDAASALAGASKGAESATGVTVFGRDPAAVARGVAAVRDLVEEFRRVETVLRLESSFAMFLLRHGAANIAKFRSKVPDADLDIGDRIKPDVLARAVKLAAQAAAADGDDDDDEAEDSDSNSDDEEDEAASLFLPAAADGVRLPSRTFTLRARRTLGEEAKAALLELYQEFQEGRRRVIVPAAAARAIVRGGGAEIKKLRSACPKGVALNVAFAPEPASKDSRRGGDRRGGRDEPDDAVIPPPGKAVIVLRVDTVPPPKGGKGGKRARKGAAKDAADDDEAADAAAAAAADEAGDKADAPKSDADRLTEAEAMVREAVASFREASITVPDHAVPAILGRGGAVISKLQSDSGASITLERGPALKTAGASADDDSNGAAADAASASGRGRGSGGGKGRGDAGKRRRRPQRRAYGPSTVHVSGLDDAVTKAVAAIEKIMESQQSEEVPGADDPDVRAAIIGTKGANIRSLQSESGSRIDIDSARGVFLVIGTSEQVAKGAAALREAMDTYRKTHASLNVGPDMALSVIGKGGAGVKAIEEEFAVHVNVNQSSGQVTVRAESEEALQAAVAHIREQTGMDKPQVEVAYDRSKADRVLPMVFGRGGASLRKLQDTHSVVVAVDRVKGLLLVRGEEDAIAAAAAELTQTVKDGSKTVIEFSVPASAVSAIVGAGGSTIQSLQRLTRTSIDLRRGATAAGGSDGRPGVPASRSRTGGRSGGRTGGRSRGSAAAADPTAARVTIRGATAAAKAAEAAIRAIADGKAQAVLPLLPAMAECLLGAERAVLERLSASGVRCTMRGWSARRSAAPAPAAPTNSLLVSSLWGTASGAGMAAAGASADAAAAASAPAAEPRAKSEEEDDEDEDESEGPRLVLCVLAAADAERLGDAQASIEFALSHKFASQMARVPCPPGVLEAIMRDANTAPQRRGPGPAPTEAVSRLSADSLAARHGLASVWVNHAVGHAVLCGPEAAVAAARAEVQAVAAAHAALRGVVPLPLELIPAIVGRGGARIMELEKETGCRLQVLKPGDDRAAADTEAMAVLAENKAVIRVVGKSAEEAMAAVESLAAEVARIGSLRRSVPIPAGGAGAVVGRGGETIRGIIAETGAGLRVSEDRTHVMVSADTAEAVERAHEMIKEALEAAGVSADGAPGAEAEVVIECSRSSAVAVIGRGGETVRRIQADNPGARIDIQADDGIVRVHGSAAAVEAAEAAVREVINQSEDAQRERRAARDAADEEHAEGGAAGAAAGGEGRSRRHGRNAGGAGGQPAPPTQADIDAEEERAAAARAATIPEVPLGAGPDYLQRMRERQQAEARSRKARGGGSRAHAATRTHSHANARAGAPPGSDDAAQAKARADKARVAAEAAPKDRRTAADDVLSLLQATSAEPQASTPVRRAPAAPAPRGPPPGLGFTPQSSAAVSRTAGAGPEAAALRRPPPGLVSPPAPLPAATPARVPAKAAARAPAPAAPADEIDPLAFLGLSTGSTPTLASRAAPASGTSAASSRTTAVASSSAGTMSAGGVTIRF